MFGFNKKKKARRPVRFAQGVKAESRGVWPFPNFHDELLSRLFSNRADVLVRTREKSRSDSIVFQTRLFSGRHTPSKNAKKLTSYNVWHET